MIEQEFADLYPLTGEGLAEYLPDVDCRECGFSSCGGFAEALVNGEATSGQCPELDGQMSSIIDAVLAFPLPVIPYNVMMESFPAGLVRVGEPEASAPVLVTGNFQETVRLLEGILNACDIPAFLLLSDTKGYSIDNAIVEKRFTPFEILAVITNTEVGSLISHRRLVIPGLARHLASQVKQFTGWQVEVGPVSGFELPLFLATEGFVRTQEG